MQRYRLTKSGVCDCMLPDDNGPWVKYEDAEQAHRQGWEQGKRECAFIVQYYEHDPAKDGDFADQLDEVIAMMEYKEPTDES